VFVMRVSSLAQTVTFNSVTKPVPFLESLVVAVQLWNSS
jgi:hypothetical protein